MNEPLTKEERATLKLPHKAPAYTAGAVQKITDRYELNVLDLERQLAAKDAQIAVLTEALTIVSHDECICRACKAVILAVLTPDLIALAADYRDALAVRERVRELLKLRKEYSPQSWDKGVIPNHILYEKQVFERLLGKETG